MILNKDNNPERDIYYLGALVIDLLSKISIIDYEVFDVFQLINEREKVSMNLFALVLDWLFMLGAINLINGHIQKCF
jgi:hypothetical protein